MHRVPATFGHDSQPIEPPSLRRRHTAGRFQPIDLTNQVSSLDAIEDGVAIRIDASQESVSERQEPVEVASRIEEPSAWIVKVTNDIAALGSQLDTDRHGRIMPRLEYARGTCRRVFD